MHGLSLSGGVDCKLKFGNWIQCISTYSSCFYFLSSVYFRYW